MGLVEREERSQAREPHLLTWSHQCDGYNGGSSAVSPASPSLVSSDPWLTLPSDLPLWVSGAAPSSSNSDVRSLRDSVKSPLLGGRRDPSLFGSQGHCTALARAWGCFSTCRPKTRLSPDCGQAEATSVCAWPQNSIRETQSLEAHLSGGRSRAPAHRATVTRPQGQALPETLCSVPGAGKPQEM